MVSPVLKFRLDVEVKFCVRDSNVFRVSEIKRSFSYANLFSGEHESIYNAYLENRVYM